MREASPVFSCFSFSFHFVLSALAVITLKSPVTVYHHLDILTPMTNCIHVLY